MLSFPSFPSFTILQNVIYDITVNRIDRTKKKIRRINQCYCLKDNTQTSKGELIRLWVVAVLTRKHTVCSFICGLQPAHPSHAFLPAFLPSFSVATYGTIMDMTGKNSPLTLCDTAGNVASQRCVLYFSKLRFGKTLESNECFLSLHFVFP